MSIPNDSADNAEIQAGLKRAEPAMLIAVLTAFDFYLVQILHRNFPYQTLNFPYELLSNEYWFTLGIMIQSLIFYSIATRYRPPDADS